MKLLSSDLTRTLSAPRDVTSVAGANANAAKLHASPIPTETYIYINDYIQGVPEKNAQCLMQHNCITLSVTHIFTWFSPKCSESN